MSEAHEDLDLTQTLTGRLRNFPLSPSPDNALIGLYEAISNSIHAIRDRSPQAGTGSILVEVHRSGDVDVDGFTVTDDGIGLNDTNFTSFRKIDSTFKAVRGGKGVGRLAWLKTFDKISVDSVFSDDGQPYRRTFDFIADDLRPIQRHLLVQTSGHVRTVVQLRHMKPEYARECPKKTETIARSIVRHFLRDVIAADSPSLTLIDDDQTLDLKDFFQKAVERREEDVFAVEFSGVEQEFRITHVVASKAFADHDAKENVIYLLAHGRVVGRRPIGDMIGLRKLQGGRTYIGLVEGDYLDDVVTQERTMLAADVTITDQIVRRAGERAVNFLALETQPLRDRQVQMVQQIKREYPRFIGTLAEEKDFVEKKLPLSVRDQESVFQRVSLEWYRSKRKVDRSIRTGLINPKNEEEFQKALSDATASIRSESRAILADYLAERKVVLDFLNRLVQRSRVDSSYQLESKIHDLVLPRKANSANVKLETHNLWLIDERLPYYYYFNSDQQLKKQIDGSDDARRPDVTLFDVASAFAQRGNNEPFILVEFKRPGRDDYNHEQDPVKQCYDYVLEMRAGRKLTDADGAWISTVNDNTLFYCYIVADLTPSLRKLADFHDLRTTPDGRGVFRFHERINAWIEVIPFDKLIENNRVRHNSFFEKLGLT